MKLLFALATVGLSAFSASAFAQAALPAGLYEINGTVTAVTGSTCPLATNRPVTGHIYYPGVGHDTTQILLESVVPGKSVTVEFHYAFSAVPANGLNGWTATSPVSPDYME